MKRGLERDAERRKSERGGGGETGSSEAVCARLTIERKSRRQSNAELLFGCCSSQGERGGVERGISLAFSRSG